MLGRMSIIDNDNPASINPDMHVYGVVFHSTAKLWVNICFTDDVLLRIGRGLFY